MSRSFVRSGDVRARFPRVSGDEPPTARRSLEQLSFPRVSGDEPSSARVTCGRAPFSPRERG